MDIRTFSPVAQPTIKTLSIITVMIKLLVDNLGERLYRYALIFRCMINDIVQRVEQGITATFIIREFHWAKLYGLHDNV